MRGIKFNTIGSIAIVFLIIIILHSCGQGSAVEENKSNVAENKIASVDPMESKGFGPIVSLELGEIDNAMVEAGKNIYNSKCTACHNISTKLIGPPQAGIIDRRSPEWIMNMILNPAEMLEKDPTAKALLKEFNNVPMTAQGLTEEEARNILEYFRTI